MGIVMFMEKMMIDQGIWWVSLNFVKHKCVEQLQRKHHDYLAEPRWLCWSEMFRDFRKVEDPRVNYHSYGNHHLQQVQHGTTINGPVSIATLDYVRVSKVDND